MLERVEDLRGEDVHAEVSEEVAGGEAGSDEV